MNTDIKRIEHQSEQMSNIVTHYTDYQNILDNRDFAQLQQLIREFRLNAEQALQENRLLRIGIVGQVKRGKSSFLNSLLFQGSDVLPKAATPMTAALTRIHYAVEPAAKIEFYSHQEWKKIVSIAKRVQEEELAWQQATREHQSPSDKTNNKEFRAPPVKSTLSDEEQACLELYKMVQQSGVNVKDYLDKTHTIDGITDNADLINQLQNYVGANGEYTPIVKSTELSLAQEALQDIEVVDTPGLNDPVISRARRTQEFLGQCDVIFLLSYCSQFMDFNDMSLLAQNIPNKGVKHIVLIGSMVDSVLLDEGDSYSTIEEALPAILDKLNTQASNNVNRVVQQDQAHHNALQELMHTLKKALPPVFISSRCYDLARKGNNLNEDERHTLKNLNGLFEGFEFTSDILLAIGNFSAIEKKLEIIQADKKEILSERFENILKGARCELSSLLQKFYDQVKQQREYLLEGDLEETSRKLQKLIKRIEQGKTRVDAVFQTYSIRVERKLSELELELKKDAQTAKQVKSQTGSREEAYEVSREVYDPELKDIKSWFFKKKVYETHYRTITYTYANVDDAVGELESFIIKTGERLFQFAGEVIQIKQFRQDIKQAVRDMFDFDDEQFDPEMILLPLSNAVERLVITPIELDMEHHIETIWKQFNTNEVEGEKISQLRKEQGRIVKLLLQDIGVELQKNKTHILDKLEHEKQKFIPELSKDLQASIERLENDLQNKNTALETYNSLLELLEQDLNGMIN